MPTPDTRERNYLVEQAESANELSRLCSLRIREGWIPTGGINSVHTPGGRPPVMFSQALWYPHHTSKQL